MFNDDTRDEPLDEQLSSLAKSYHQPNATPRDAIWSRVEAARQAGGQAASGVVDLASARGARVRRRLSVFRWPIAAAALLGLGIGIGRYSADAPVTSAPQLAQDSDSLAARPPGRLAASDRLAASSGQLTPYEVATASHLMQSESYLTLFRSAATDGNLDSIPVGRARQLLANNQLLLDSPAAQDPRLRMLLQDLELVLMEISQFGSTRRATDLDLITTGMERGAMLTRLRVAAPSTARPLPQGIL